ncbi:hypothetical protein ERJ75_000217700 [Trypanosoma vivax]|uniref:PCI domain-containing protein n=1 Tax=Trypanosoma vivax (strain Y486) TaxID=1055687 RepID=G0U9R2_TRYVY|nr:hypothetical protein TRVL_04305 [Trypanosoma vivax]KAH8618998.1 hypothetical protein ERJ75_000217700 [Trypanosoma vivax]CCC52543.1 conserved hypothetical protein [Trypanosoma vivax Y486]
MYCGQAKVVPLTQCSTEEYVRRITAAASEAEAAELVMEAVRDPRLFFYGAFLSIPVVKALGTLPAYAGLVQLLEVLCFGTLGDLLALPDSVQEQLTPQVREKACKLTVLSLCRGNALSISDVRQMVGDAVESVEVLLMEMMSDGLLSGRIDQCCGLLRLREWAPREVPLSDVGALRAKIEALCESCDSQISLLRQLMCGMPSAVTPSTSSGLEHFTEHKEQLGA